MRSRPLGPTLLTVLTLLALLAIATTPVAAQDSGTSSADDVALTVYSSADPAGFDPQQFVAQQRQGWNPSFAWQVPGFGVVKEVRRLALPEGTGTVRITDVAEFIHPTTVSFADLDAPTATSILDQSFQFDLVSPAKLLERYVDHEIRLRETTKDETGKDVETWTTGTVLSASQGQVVLQTPDGLRFVAATSPDLRLPKLPDGLITRPTLVWNVASEQAGTRRVRTTYRTGGLTWRSDYNLVLSGDDTQADIGAWVTLLNLSGAAYPNARLKLIAGDVQQIQSRPQAPTRRMRGADKGGGSAGFEEKEFFEYHLYTLPRRIDIAQNATQQIALFPTAQGVGVEKVLVYYGVPGANRWSSSSPQTDRNLGNSSNHKVDVYVKFANEESNRLGIPLPKGKVRVFKRDEADGTLEFVGEDLIDHTPRDETVLIKLGQAFDVVGERTQTDFKVDTGRKTLEETVRIQLRNHKDVAVNVIAREVLFRWTNWEMLDQTDPYEKQDARTIHFPVEVPARGEKTITYRVRYTW